MSSKPGNSGLIARRVISLASARLRLLFVPVLIAWALLGVGLGAVQQAQAQSRDEDSGGGGVRHIVVTLYKSRTLVLEQPFASVVVGSPDLVDALPMSDRRLYIQGKKVGTTNVSVFNQSMQLAGVIDVEVTLDTGNLQEKIRASTGSSAIRVGSSNGQIVLSGARQQFGGRRPRRGGGQVHGARRQHRECDESGPVAAGDAQGPIS